MPDDDIQTGVQIGEAVTSGDLEADPGGSLGNDREPEPDGEKAVIAQSTGETDRVRGCTDNDGDYGRPAIEGADASC